MLYYLPNVSSPHPADLSAIAYAFEGKPRFAPVLRGPFDGPAGVVVCDARAPRADRLGLYEDQQTWRKAPGDRSQGSGVSVGFWNDERPGPQHLVRRAPLAGHAVELADGRVWQCPAAVQWEDGDSLTRTVTLPHGLDLDDAGEWVVGAILPDHAKLWEIAERWQTFYASRYSDDAGETFEAEIELAEVFDDACACLAANYRVSRIEVATLGLMTEISAFRVLNALIDEPGLAAILQKKTGD